MKISILIISLFSIIVSSMGNVVRGFDEKEVSHKLSELSEEQCLEILYDNGLDTSEKIILGDGSLLEIVKFFEENPNQPIVVNYEEAHLFYESIRHAVNSYYGYSDDKVQYQSTRNGLQYSTVVSWDASTMRNYNCYAFALGLNQIYAPGEFSGQTYSGTMSIDSVAQLIKDDLKTGLGYQCVTHTSEQVNQIGDWDNVIAVRKQISGPIPENYDYHVAKMVQNGVWHHKPGATAVLQFNSPPSNSYNHWCNESYNGSYYFSATVWYNSDVVFISYKTEHDYSTAWTGEHYHLGNKHYYEYTYVCRDCTHTKTAWVPYSCSGPPCMLIQPLNLQ